MPECNTTSSGSQLSTVDDEGVENMNEIRNLLYFLQDALVSVLVKHGNTLFLARATTVS